MKIIVSQQELRAASLFVSKDESRSALNGVLIEVEPSNPKPIIVATDGTRMVAIRSKAEQAEAFENPHSMLLAVDFIRVIASWSKARGTSLCSWIMFETTPGSEQLKIHIVGAPDKHMEDGDAFIEGEYPNWRKCFPSKSARRESFNTVGLNMKLFTVFDEAGEILKAGTIAQLSMIGKLVEVRMRGIPEMSGIVMSCKLGSEGERQQEFPVIEKAFRDEEDADEEEEAA